MKYLIKAVRSQVLNNVTLTAALSQVYSDRTATSPTMPYLVIEMQPSMEHIRNTGGTYIEGRSLFFSVYGTSFDTIADILEEIEREFTTSLPSLGVPLTEKSMDAVKVSDDISVDPDRNEHGEDVWHGILNLAFKIQKSVLV